MKTLKFIANLINWVVLLFLGVVSVSLVLSTLDTPLKYKVYNVTSGSMEPSIKVGSLVFVRPEPFYKAGEVVTYKSNIDPKGTVTHRIVEETPEGFKTKGDANEDPDVGVLARNKVIGRVLFSIPFLGFPLAFAKTQLGFMLLVVVPATILVYTELSSIKTELTKMLTNRKKKGQKPKEEISSLIGGE